MAARKIVSSKSHKPAPTLSKPRPAAWFGKGFFADTKLVRWQCG